MMNKEIETTIIAFYKVRIREREMALEDIGYSKPQKPAFKKFTSTQSLQRSQKSNLC